MMSVNAIRQEIIELGGDPKKSRNQTGLWNKLAKMRAAKAGDAPNGESNGSNGVAEHAEAKDEPKETTVAAKKPRKAKPAKAPRAAKPKKEAKAKKDSAKDAPTPAQHEKTVERIKALHKDKKSLYEIKAILEEKGIRTARGGEVWWPSSIQSALGQRW